MLFAGQQWKELRFDINPDAKPDLVGTMTNMNALFSSLIFNVCTPLIATLQGGGFAQVASLERSNI
jgi:hypothetical protein